MRFIIFVIDGPNNPAKPNEIETIDLFNDRLKQGRNWVTAAGIAGPAQALLIDNRDGKQEVQAESLFSSSEYYSGFWIVEVKNEKEAEELALAGSLACNRKVELRPYL